MAKVFKTIKIAFTFLKISFKHYFQQFGSIYFIAKRTIFSREFNMNPLIIMQPGFQKITYDSSKLPI